jgi:hypothetical protein
MSCQANKYRDLNNLTYQRPWSVPAAAFNSLRVRRLRFRSHHAA